VNRAMTLPAITAENLVREFGAGTRAVDGIDLEVFPGEIYGFLGPNGAGKSTTVLMLTTLLPATGGKATVGGFDIARQGPQVRAAIGAALQEASLDVMLTGRAHLRFQATLRGIGKATAAERTAELLDRVGLTEAADRRVGDYSGGMKRRLDLAMALVHQPAILFLDEPTTGLDLQSRAGLWDEVARLAHDDGATVFLTGPEVLRAGSRPALRGPRGADRSRVQAARETPGSRAQAAEARAPVDGALPCSG